MYKHKSFVLERKKKPEVQIDKEPSKQIKTPTPPQKENGVTEVAHYDKNEPISLSIPQSLSTAYELECDHVHGSAHNTAGRDANAMSYDFSVDEFSDANAYFLAEEDFENKKKHVLAASESTEVAPEDGSGSRDTTEAVIENDQQQPTSDSETDEDNTEPTTDIEILDSDAIREEDKKFEEDMKAIMKKKKEADQERMKNKPEDAKKLKSHGIKGPKESTEQVEEKMKNEHAIFDKIAKSMEMADSYDLGAITMDKKFDELEVATDKDFTEKINSLMDEEKRRNEQIDLDVESKEEENKEEEIVDEAENKEEQIDDALKNKKEESREKGDDKIMTDDFLDDLEKVNEIEKKYEAQQALSEQASFSSTISIRHRYLKSRVFHVSSGRVEVILNSHWNPSGCSPLTHINVTLMEQNTILRDTDHGTRRFKIGTTDVHSWSGLPQANYYLIFSFTNNTNPHCELTGTVDVRT